MFTHKLKNKENCNLSTREYQNSTFGNPRKNLVKLELKKNCSGQWEFLHCSPEKQFQSLNKFVQSYEYTIMLIKRKKTLLTF